MDWGNVTCESKADTYIHAITHMAVVVARSPCCGSQWNERDSMCVDETSWEVNLMGISGGHSNTERGYLVQLKPRLLQELASGDGEVLEVTISQADKDPLTIV